MKIKNLLLSLILVNATVIGGFTYVTNKSLTKNSEYIAKATKAGVTYQSLTNGSRKAQIEFQRQIQEWKNILIRGNDNEMYKKYLDSFDNQEKLVQEQLLTVKSIAAKNNLTDIKDDIDKLVEIHKGVGVTYKAALSSFDGADPETGKKVDKLLKGVDRAISTGMESLSNKIIKLSETEVSKLNTLVEAKNEGNILDLIFASLALFLVIGLSFAILSSYLNRVIGAEPSNLNDYLRELAQGNFKFNFELKKNDKDSVAYNSKMMHFKIRNMIKTIKNMTKDIDNQISSSKLGDSGNEILETLRNTKKEVRGLSEVVEKFDI